MTGPSRKLAIASERLNDARHAASARTGPDDPHHGANEISDHHGRVGDARLAAVAHAEYAARRRRDKLFDADLFAEPAWDMLLDLFIQRHHERPVSVHSLCIAAAVPQTTALRWIGKLAEKGLIDRRNCTHDNRVIYIMLSEAGLDIMRRYLAGQLGGSGPAGSPPLAFS
ncbi:helix-turn-helix domain-containing protein [Sphingopyxis solisilvae]|uniref:hypothetical protein n=1 Tax=Sphingopyxis solisilvae TaxID=1886788 RepID=UPI00189296D2|nr:hypothetical protein [Sphingopyxis solisilvae]